MRFLCLCVVVALTLAAPASAQELGDYYVGVPVLNERAAPKTGEVVNRIYRGQKVTVYEIRDGWAQIDTPGFEERWVIFKSLTRERPAELSQEGVASVDDPRIEPDAIPHVGDNNLSKEDVNLLWRGAKHMLDTGACTRIVLGDKSISKRNTYYVTCEDSTNHFFTAEDLQ